MQEINECSYFDYQKERVHARKGKIGKYFDREKIKHRKTRNRVNKVVEIDATVCPQCGSSDISKINGLTRKVTDLKFFESGAKRWITKYVTSKYICGRCKHAHTPKEYIENARQHYGHDLKCWTIFQHIVNKESFRQIESNCLEFFNIKLPSSSSHQFKRYIAEYYGYTQKKLLQRILNSHVIYVDETPFNLLSETVYAWVFTNGCEVVSLYKTTREGKFLKELLQDIKGVIVSDYYSAYDSIDSSQQKCLIHLMRDFNDDLLKNPFDNELKFITQKFTVLLQGIVKTIDKYGLKKRHLNKHKKEVKAFFKNVFNKEYSSEVAQKYLQRLIKNKDKLFTFLNYDDVGWNNTNAEHAIKILATHRNMNIKFYRSSNIEDYLKVMSLYQTCEYKGISFLQFMLSREVDFDKFTQKLGKTKKIRNSGN
ncbi:MAG: transposase [Thermodesulfobacteriota bacterium]